MDSSNATAKHNTALRADREDTPDEATAAAKPWHTPTPWTVRDASGYENARLEVVAVVDSRIVIVADCGREGNGIAQANAHLIAAAPDLLAACHGGQDAQPYAMPHNLAYYATLLERGNITDEMRAVMVHTLTDYSRTLNAAINSAEAK